MHYPTSPSPSPSTSSFQQQNTGVAPFSTSSSSSISSSIISTSAPIAICIPPTPLSNNNINSTIPLPSNQSGNKNGFDKKLETHLLRQTIALILYGRGFQKTHKGSIDVLSNILETIILNILKDLKRTAECLPSPIALPSLLHCGGHWGAYTHLTIQDAFPLLLPTSSTTHSHSPPKYISLYRSLDSLIEFCSNQPSVPASSSSKYLSTLEHKGLIPLNSTIIPKAKIDFPFSEEKVENEEEKLL